MRKTKYFLGGVILFLIVLFGISWSWTYTPHGRLDYRAALSLKLLSFETTIKPHPGSDFEITMPVNLAYALSNKLPPEKVSRTEDVTIESDYGTVVPARIYWPKGFESFDRPPPVTLYFHGGGFVVGSVDIFDQLTRSLANATSTIVVSVDYRLAPAHPYPAAVNDCYASLLWLADHATGLGGDATRLLVAGDSAGAHLAAVTALRARQESGPPLSAQVLYYPAADLTDAHYDSRELFADGYGLSSESMATYSEAYVGHVENLHDPYVSPLYAESHAGLPPALIVTAGFDPLADLGRAYATRLKNSGVVVREIHYPEMIHGFMSIRMFSQRRQALNETADFLGEVFPSSSRTGSRR